MHSELLEKVLSYPKLQERLSKYPKDQAKISKNLNEIKSDYSKKYINNFKNFLDATLVKLYDGISFNENNVNFRNLVDNNHVVLVPNHQSHADYMAMSYIIFKKFEMPLFIAGGKNLNIFPIGTLFKKSGCFFIRRTFASDIVYKLTLEAYLYVLLQEGWPIEFFFEGGRSRSGKLLAPKFGLYQMLLEAHSFLPEEKKKKLLFLPVSINHEYVPEQKSLAREMKGAKKKKESPKQLLSIFKLVSYQFGNVHINLGEPIAAEKHQDETLRKDTYDLAFKCFRTVGKNMMVTPSSLLAIVILDNQTKAIEINELKNKAKILVDHCSKFNIPYTKSLEDDCREDTIQRALDILVGNGKIELMRGAKGGQVFYTVRDEARHEILYFKNSILHHFLVPWMINRAWMSIFSGSLNDVSDLKKLFLGLRNQLKFEFYLPSVREMYHEAVEIISHAIGRKVDNLEECLNLTHKELYDLASHVGVFSRSLRFIHEAYYIASLTLKDFSENMSSFSREDYDKKFKEVHSEEFNLGKIILNKESFSTDLRDTTFKYFTGLKVIIGEEDLSSYKIERQKILDIVHNDLEKHLIQQLTFSMNL